MRSTAILYAAAIAIAVFTTATAVHAADTSLPVGVTLVRCGNSNADIPKACEADSRCCVFMDKAPPQSLAQRWLEVEQETVFFTPETVTITEATAPETMKTIEIEEKKPAPATPALLPPRLTKTTVAAHSSYRSAYMDGYGTVIE